MKNWIVEKWDFKINNDESIISFQRIIIVSIILLLNLTICLIVWFILQNKYNSFVYCNNNQKDCGIVFEGVHNCCNHDTVQECYCNCPNFPNISCNNVTNNYSDSWVIWLIFPIIFVPICFCGYKLKGIPTRTIYI